MFLVFVPELTMLRCMQLSAVPLEKVGDQQHSLVSNQTSINPLLSKVYTNLGNIVQEDKSAAGGSKETKMITSAGMTLNW